MRLKKSLGAIEIFSIATGAMISSGLFVLPGLAFAKCGPAVILAYLFAGIIVIPSMLSMAELATAMPKAGGTYFFIERSLGPWAGTLAGLANWFSLSFKSAFALAGMGAFAILVFPGITEFQMDMIAIFFCVLFSVVNLVSAKHAGRAQVFLVLFLLAILALFTVFGLEKIDLDLYKDFNPRGAGAVFATMGLIFVSFGGLTKVASVAEETKKPGRNIPMGMLTAYVVVSIFYVLVVAITVGVLSPGKLSWSLTPVSLAAETFMGTPGMIILSVAALTAFVTTANAGILTASRAPLAMSADNLLPPLFNKVHPRRKTPTVSILVTSIFMICVILFLDMENLVKTASTMMLLLFTTVNLSVIVMRESKIHSYRPIFRAPLCPLLQVTAIIIYGFIIFEMGRIPLFVTALFFLLGTLWYFLYARRTANRRSALMCVVERITARELCHPSLERELKEILVERDEMIEDRFDRLVKESPIIDFEERISSREAFGAIAHTLAPILKEDEGALLDLFLKREEQSSTVIRPGLAIPHILVEGEGIFHLLLVRSRPGIIFAGAEEPVHAVFVLIGSPDERNYHLRALMAVAQISQGPDFDERWMNAQDEQELRNIVLLAGRQRGD